jgi:hypothetical protein
MLWLALLLLAAFPGRAEERMIGRVTVRGGHTVRGVEDGVIFTSRFGLGCKVWTTPLRPIAASLKSSVALDLEIVGCPGAIPVGSRCRSKVRGFPYSPWFEVSNGRVTLPLALPPLTGVYLAEIHCEAGRELLPLTTTLYLTYAKPRPIIQPAEEVWFERACTWGNGFDVSAKEADVVEKILNNLYFFGQRNWRYGLCSLQGSTCTFGGTKTPSDDLYCVPDGGFCKAHWFQMVEGDWQRNFSDCYVMTDILQYITATMGIGGMVDRQVFGYHEKGFMTRAVARAFDPAFAGNVSCGRRAEPCSYTFWNHDLRKWGNRIYDPTFGSLYRKPQDVYGQSVVGGSDSLLFFEETTACIGKVGYGLWFFYREIPHAPGDCLVTDDSLASFAAPPQALESVDINGATVLAANVQVQIETGGSYVVSGQLFNANGTQLISARPVYNIQSTASRAIVAGPPGLYTARLLFSAEDVTRGHHPGGFTLQAQLLDSVSGVNLDSLGAFLPPLSPDLIAKVGERSARFLEHVSPISPNWVTEPSGAAVLEVSLPVQIRTPGFFATDARLWQGDETIAYGGERIELSLETAEVTLRFELGERKLPAGRYGLSVSLHHVDPPAPVSSRSIEIDVSPPP